MKLKFISIVIFIIPFFACNNTQKNTETLVEDTNITETITAKEQTNNKGLIVLENMDLIENYCCILSPKDGFNLYNKPNGESVGTLVRGEDEYAIFRITDGGQIKLETDNFKEIGYEIWAVEYSEEQNGFVKILTNYNEGYWLSKAEIVKSGLNAVSWKDYLIQDSKKGGYFPNDPGVNLHEKPTIESEIIELLIGDLFNLKLSNETQGNWCKVIVVKYKEHPCGSDLSETENIEYKKTGWIKIIDDNGEPTIWKYTRGC